MDNRILLVYEIIAVVAIVSLVPSVYAEAPPLPVADASITEGTGLGTTAISFDLSTSALSHPITGSVRYSPMSIRMMPTS